MSPKNFQVEFVQIDELTGLAATAFKQHTAYGLLGFGQRRKFEVPRVHALVSQGHGINVAVSLFPHLSHESKLRFSSGTNTTDGEHLFGGQLAAHHNGCAVTADYDRLCLFVKNLAVKVRRRDFNPHSEHDTVTPASVL